VLPDRSGGTLFADPQHPYNFAYKEKAMELAQPLQVGDRVRVVRKHGDLPKRSSGTIIRVFETADCSDVQFDSRPGHRLIANSDLAVIEQKVESTRI
jgi:hypothetical protein